jgi:hypothetical protein
VLTSVPFSHATPAAFGAQSASRNSYGAISEQMLTNPALDLIMGAGHPLFDADGRPRSSPDYRYVSADAWAALQGPASPRTLIQTRADFEALAQGKLQPRTPLLGLVQVHDTLQANRSAAVVGDDPQLPSGVARIGTVPTLATMTRGALQVLGRQPQGFFMMVEGGAVDWMAHANNTRRVIEEQMDFNHAVQAAVDWVNANSHWGETLIIVLTDHGNGMPMGPDSDRVPFEPIRNQGKGVLPGVRWHHGSHSNENTLLWAHGAGAQQLLQAAQTLDPALVQPPGPQPRRPHPDQRRRGACAGAWGRASALTRRGRCGLFAAGAAQGLAATCVACATQRVVQLALQLVQRAVHGVGHLGGLVAHGQRCVPGQARFQRALFVGHAHARGAGVTEVRFDACDVLGKTRQLVLDLGLHPGVERFTALDFVVGVDLYLHGCFRERRAGTLRPGHGLPLWRAPPGQPARPAPGGGSARCGVRVRQA